MYKALGGFESLEFDVASVLNFFAIQSRGCLCLSIIMFPKEGLLWQRDFVSCSECLANDRNNTSLSM